MKKKSYISVSNLKFGAYDSTSLLAIDYPDVCSISDREDFLFFNDTDHLAVTMEIYNEEINNPNFTGYPLFLAVEVCLCGEVVASKDFTVCMEPGIRTIQPRIDLELPHDEILTNIDYTVQVRQLSVKRAYISRTLRFFSPFMFNDRFKIISGCIEQDEVKMRNVKEQKSSFFEYVRFVIENTGFSWDRLPEFKARHYNSDGHPVECDSTIGKVNPETHQFTVTFHFDIENHKPGVEYFEVLLFGHAVTGLLFTVGIEDEAGEFSPEEMARIPNYTPEAGLEIMEKRGMRLPIAKHARHTLERLVGLENVKKKLTDYDNLMRFFKMRRDQKLPSAMPPMHALFLGSPGTGKTTVAKLMGELMKDAGALSKGHVVIKERASLLTQYYGGAEQLTREALEEAQGGILFIDEAYQLHAPNDPKDPGKDILRTLMTATADDKNRDWMLILAGYTQPVLNMLDMNPGLASRFPRSNHYVFNDFTPEELIEIATRYFHDNDFSLTDEAKAKMEMLLRSDYENRKSDFGNARHVLNLIQTSILPAMANRVALSASPTREQLSLVCPADIPQPGCLYIPKQERRHLGFS